MSGEDGPEAPSAPEAPSPQEPQEQPEPAEPAGEEGAESRRPRLLPVWLLLGAAVIAGGAWAVTERMGGEQSSSDEASVPLITASAEPWKVRPDDPGGMEIPNQGTLIYETLTTADPEEAPEQILPPPEEPMSPPLPEADRAEELRCASGGAERGRDLTNRYRHRRRAGARPVEEAKAVERGAEVAGSRKNSDGNPRRRQNHIGGGSGPAESEPREWTDPPAAAASRERSRPARIEDPAGRISVSRQTEALPPEAEPEVAGERIAELT